MVSGQGEAPPPETGGDFDAYYRADSKKLYGFVLKLGASFQEAEDTVQDTMEEIFKRWDRIGITNPAAYARRVAEHKFIGSRVRLRDERRKLLEAGWATERAFDSHHLLLKEEARWLITIMQDLPYEQRRVLAWHADGFETAEIAGSIARPESTVRSNLRHARAAVRAAMAARRSSTTTARKEAGQ